MREKNRRKKKGRGKNEGLTKDEPFGAGVLHLNFSTLCM